MIEATLRRNADLERVYEGICKDEIKEYLFRDPEGKFFTLLATDLCYNLFKLNHPVVLKRGDTERFIQRTSQDIQQVRKTLQCVFTIGVKEVKLTDEELNLYVKTLANLATLPKEETT